MGIGRRLELTFGLAALLGAVAALAPSQARACGGLFCSSANPVNQAAEQILFVENPNGTITAVIQIVYEGPAHEFAWVLPVPGVPDVAVSSDQALNAIKQATNPLYQLQTTFGSCGGGKGLQAPSAGADFDNSSADAGAGSGVSVEASGAIGPYDYTVIRVDPGLPDLARVAIDWLMQNGYDTGELGPDLLRPYLEEGLNLLAFKLTKGNSTGSIRPVMITYDAELASIPIRPTAVAANDDMGVLVWVLSSERAVPENYKALELNEALLDWFNPMNNYNAVVIKAADEAMGQGFVTEYAGRHQDLGIAIFDEYQQEQWMDFAGREHTDPVAMVQEASTLWANLDGFDDALQAAVTLPAEIDFEDFRRCMRCYLADPGVVFDSQVYLQKLYELAIEPMIATQELLDSRPYMTRFYTTMSADEMTLDPVFATNPDLDPVSNTHTAEQMFDCEGPGWRIKLAQGATVRGFEAGVWPIEIKDAPAALKIMQLGTSGQGRVITDRTDAVTQMIRERNTETRAQAEADGLVEDSGCAIGHGRSRSPLGLLLLALGLLLRRRRSLRQ